MKRIKVFIFVPTLQGGGAERVSSQIASSLNPETFDVTLILGKKEGIYLPLLPANLTTLDLNKSHIRNCIFPLAMLFRKEKPDVLISFLHHTNIASLLAKVISFSPVKVIVAERNIMEYVHRNTPTAFIFAERILYRFSAASLGGSKGLQENVSASLRIPKEKFRIIYNPLDISFIHKKSKEQIHHPWFQKDKQSLIVLGIGRLVPQKDFSTLIRAFTAAKKPIGTRLVILGEGPQRIELLSLIQKLGINSTVDLPGFYTNPYAFLARADIFILSSLWEGFGNVLLEAFACGTPSISTDCDYGPNEVIESGVNGLLVPPSDTLAMARAIEHMLFDRVFALQCGERAQATAQRFHIDRIAKQYEEFILSVVR